MLEKDSFNLTSEIDAPLGITGWLVRLLNVASETLVLAMVCISPWALGAVDAEFEFYLFAGIGLLLVLWALRMLVQWRVQWKACPVAMCLAAIIMLGVFQLAPLPKTVIASLSPGTTRVYERLLPTQPEALPENEAREKLAVPAGSTLSLYPDATRKSLIRLLAIFSLYVIVRNNLASIGVLRRLCVALLANAAALSIFGLIQFFSVSEPGSIYWTYASAGAPFGPFVNHNHFAFYMNICIGPAVGLLLFRSSGISLYASEIDVSVVDRLKNFVQKILQDPVALWISGGLALMICSVAFCLSRGGYIALLGAATVTLTLSLWRGGRNVSLAAALLSVAIALGLMTWFGFEVLEDRLATLWNGEALGDDRVFLLTNAWSQISEFPLWGTGYGTFEFVEPIKLHTARDVGKFYEHAHNDYLEVLIEGGIVRLVLRLIAIGLILRFAYRAFRDHMGNQTGALALGLLFAFTTIVIHSFFEFGLYVPSIAVLAIVLCAHIGNLGESPALESDPSGPKSNVQSVPPQELAFDGSSQDETESLGSWRISPLVGAVFAVFLGYFFYSEGSKAATIDRLRSDARQLRRAALIGAVEWEAELPQVEAVVAMDPNDAERRFVLAEAHFEVYKQQSEVDQSDSIQTENETDSANEHLQAALRHILAARDLCPLLPAPHTQIAVHVNDFVSAEPRSAYMARAKYLAPADPQLWYFCGLQELDDHQPAEAWKSWRESLQLSDRCLTRILDQAVTLLSPDEMLTKILPNQPAILLAAAHYLYPQPEAIAERRPFLEKALAACRTMPLPLDSTQLFTRAMLLRELGQAEQAVDDFQTAIAQDPKQLDWRYELATLFQQLGRSQEARRELGIILVQRPNHSAALRLIDLLDAESQPSGTTP